MSQRWVELLLLVCSPPLQRKHSGDQNIQSIYFNILLLEFKNLCLFYFISVMTKKVHYKIYYSKTSRISQKFRFNVLFQKMQYLSISRNRLFCVEQIQYLCPHLPGKVRISNIFMVAINPLLITRSKNVMQTFPFLVVSFVSYLPLRFHVEVTSSFIHFVWNLYIFLSK